MALSAITKAGIRGRAFDRYGEEAGGAEFSTSIMNTFVRVAVEEFALRTGIVIGSTRAARPSSSTSEALVRLASGMFDVGRIAHERAQYAGAAYKTDVRHITQNFLALAYGTNWAYASSANVGGNPAAMRWYRKGRDYIGFFPAYLAHTAGTVVIWSSKVPDVLANDTSPCQVPAEYVPGIVAIANREMARRDVDSDAEGARAQAFEAEAARYVEIAQAQVRQGWDVED